MLDDAEKQKIMDDGNGFLAKILLYNAATTFVFASGYGISSFFPEADQSTDFNSYQGGFKLVTFIGLIGTTATSAVVPPMVFRMRNKDIKDAAALNETVIMSPNTRRSMLGTTSDRQKQINMSNNLLADTMLWNSVCVWITSSMYIISSFFNSQDLPTDFSTFPAAVQSASTIGLMITTLCSATVPPALRCMGRSKKGSLPSSGNKPERRAAVLPSDSEKSFFNSTSELHSETGTDAIEIHSPSDPYDEPVLEKTGGLANMPRPLSPLQLPPPMNIAG